MKYCSECGSQLTIENAKYCPECGNDLLKKNGLGNNNNNNNQSKSTRIENTKGDVIGVGVSGSGHTIGKNIVIGLGLNNFKTTFFIFFATTTMARIVSTYFFFSIFFAIDW